MELCFIIILFSNVLMNMTQKKLLKISKKIKERMIFIKILVNLYGR